MSDENSSQDSKKRTTARWPEIEKAMQTKRYELCLVGAEIKQRIEENDGELDSELFKLTHLNFLEIAKTGLRKLPVSISLIESLTQFICHSNELELVPENSIGKCVHLKNLDLSNNKLTKLPNDLKDLKEIMTLNLSVNELTSLFPLENLTKLAVIDINHNKLSVLPADICSANLENLSQIDVSFNELVELPDEMNSLPSLKLLNAENNRIEQVPANLSQCFKLKDLLLKDNKLKDNRLKKLIDQNKAKAIIDYLERIYIEESKKAGKNNKKKPTTSALVPPEPAAPTSLIDMKKKSKIASSTNPTYDLIKVMHVNNLKDPKLNGRDVLVSEKVNEVRPYIICAIIRSLDLSEPTTFKKFLSIQTKIQDETCQKRALATIATHDLSSIKNNLFYDAGDSTKIQFVPLGRKNEMTALAYYEKLVDEAEAERKQKKRNTVSGIYKYLSLVEDQNKFPYIKDELDKVISMPPLSNSDKTKMKPETKDILVEITSTFGLDICKQVMNELVSEMLKANIASTDRIDSQIEAMNINENSKTDDNNADHAHAKLNNTLIMQQVRIVDKETGKLKWVYPSRVDLNFKDTGNSNNTRIHVARLYDEDKTQQQD